MEKKYPPRPDLVYCMSDTLIFFAIIATEIFKHQVDKITPKAPAKESVVYENRHFALLKGNTNFTGPYSGFPTPEIDDNWEALVESESSTMSYPPRIS